MGEYGCGWQPCGGGPTGPAYGGCNNNPTFVLIVVLFILLIIVGSTFIPKC